MKSCRFLFLVVCLACCCVAAFAQSTNASLTGFVDDPSKAVIPKVSITAINTETGVKSSTTSNRAGQYVLPDLIPGTYRVEVDKQGFKGIIEDGLVLHVQDVVQMNFHMAVGSMSETVSVDGSGITMNTTDASVSTVIDRKFVENMPLNGRSFQDLISMTPGVVTQSPQTSGQASGEVGDFSVNGQRTESNYYTVDGVTANISSGNGGGGAGGRYRRYARSDHRVGYDAESDIRRCLAGVSCRELYVLCRIWPLAWRTICSRHSLRHQCFSWNGL